MKPFYLVLSLIFFRVAICNAGAPTYSVRPAQNHSYKSEVNDCSLPTSKFVLDINNVRATLLTGGDMWYNTTSSAGYEVPKGPRTSSLSYPNAIYAGAVWVSGYDQGNNLKMAALLYRTNGGTDYFSGPLDNNGSTSLTECNLWDQHFPVWASQIRSLIYAYSQQGNTGALPLSSICDSIKYWPGKGNPYLSARGYNMSGILAPFFDANGDGIYDPAYGDYPTIKQGGLYSTSQTASCGHAIYDSLSYIRNSYYGDEMVFWVTNDKGNVHNGSFDGQPIGLQINSLAFAFQSSDWYNDATFYRHQLINKSGTVLNRTYFSQYTDVDLGCPNNDRVGCDTSLNLAFAYNGSNQNSMLDCDQGAYCALGTTGYGCKLPMLGIALMETPVDTGSANQVGMSSFISYLNANASTGDPANSVQFRNYQRALWKDGTHLTYGGDGYQSSSTLTNYMFPGDPSIATQWSECNPQSGSAISAGDRRFVQSAGPFTFMPCASQFLEVGVLFIDSVNSNCPSLSIFHDHLSVATAIADVPALSTFKAYPNPVSSELTLEGEMDNKINATEIYDLTGKLVSKQKGDKRSMDMSDLPEGVYMIRVYTRTGSSVTKVIKR